MYTLVQLSGDANGLVDDAHARTFEFSVTAEQAANFVVIAKVTGTSAGLGVTPATGILYQSWDAGTTWEVVPNAVNMSITVAGVYKAYPTSGSDPVSPVLKIVFAACGAGLAYTLVFVQKTYFTGTYSNKSGSSAIIPAQMSYGAGGVYVTTPVTYDTTVPANMRPFPVEVISGNAPIQFKSGAAGVHAATYVIKDTTIAANTVPLPVETIPPRTRIAARHEYAGLNVTTIAWRALGITAVGTEKVWKIFDSSGETMELGFGAPGAEAVVLTIPPGGIEINDAWIAGMGGGAISVKALSATASSGELIVQAWS
jgi:hypothetical protein